MKKRNEYLIIIDFDNTIAKTMELSPNNMGVLQAYEFAIESVLGSEGLKAYGRICGLQNRAPVELAVALLKNGDRETLIQNAKDFFEKKAPSLKKFIPAEKTISFARDADSGAETVVSEMIVLRKLSCCMDEIGTKFGDGRVWPEPCEGIADFFRTISYINRKDGIQIRLAILSSGHAPFIKKTFKVWGQTCPEILVTDDDVRMLAIEPEKKVKPSKFLFDIVFLDWTRKLEWKGAINKHRQNIMYIGDDKIKDGKLAENVGVLFGWFNPNGERNENLNGFSFGSWTAIAKFLRRQEVLKSLRKGKSLAKIFLPPFSAAIGKEIELK